MTGAWETEEARQFSSTQGLTARSVLLRVERMSFQPHLSTFLSLAGALTLAALLLRA